MESKNRRIIYLCPTFDGDGKQGSCVAIWKGERRVHMTQIHQQLSREKRRSVQRRRTLKPAKIVFNSESVQLHRPRERAAMRQACVPAECVQILRSF